MQTKTLGEKYPELTTVPVVTTEYIVSNVIDLAIKVLVEEGNNDNN